MKSRQWYLEYSCWVEERRARDGWCTAEVLTCVGAIRPVRAGEDVTTSNV